MARQIEERLIDAIITDILEQERCVRNMDGIDTQSFLEILQFMSSSGEIPQIIDRRKVDRVRRRLFVDEDQYGNGEAGRLFENKEKQSLDNGNIEEILLCNEELESVGNNDDAESSQGK